MTVNGALGVTNRSGAPGVQTSRQREGAPETTAVSQKVCFIVVDKFVCKMSKKPKGEDSDLKDNEVQTKDSIFARNLCSKQLFPTA